MLISIFYCLATDALNSMEVTANNLSQLRNLVIALFDGK